MVADAGRRQSFRIGRPSSRSGSNSAVWTAVGGRPATLSARSGDTRGSAALDMRGQVVLQVVLEGLVIDEVALRRRRGARRCPPQSRVIGHSRNWKARREGCALLIAWHTTAASVAPAESPHTPSRCGSTPSAAAWAAIHAVAAQASSRAAGKRCSGPKAIIHRQDPAAARRWRASGRSDRGCRACRRRVRRRGSRRVRAAARPGRAAGLVGAQRECAAPVPGACAPRRRRPPRAVRQKLSRCAARRAARRRTARVRPADSSRRACPGNVWPAGRAASITRRRGAPRRSPDQNASAWRAQAGHCAGSSAVDGEQRHRQAVHAEGDAAGVRELVAASREAPDVAEVVLVVVEAHAGGRRRARVVRESAARTSAPAARWLTAIIWPTRPKNGSLATSSVAGQPERVGELAGALHPLLAKRRGSPPACRCGRTRACGTTAGGRASGGLAAEAVGRDVEQQPAGGHAAARGDQRIERVAGRRRQHQVGGGERAWSSPRRSRGGRRRRGSRPRCRAAHTRTRAGWESS